ncbi:unnamed protein product [Thelazia callipaeda]|uniref:Ovule protein n=1 Tax=Thelazia callipaeda TaxID=103827 RepID=A0A0N5CZ44_THECL|nr:unnamed protein product [Thelazia callipaeda]
MCEFIDDNDNDNDNNDKVVRWWCSPDAVPIIEKPLIALINLNQPLTYSHIHHCHSLSLLPLPTPLSSPKAS